MENNQKEEQKKDIESIRKKSKANMRVLESILGE